MSRAKEINEILESVVVKTDDEWKADYFKTAISFLVDNETFEGGQICAHCRNNGLREPHHHNVWGAMLMALRKAGWTEKLGYVQPTTAHTHINAVVKWKSNLYKGIKQ